MSLSYPSRIGDQFPASNEAPENLNQLLNADPRRGKEQVTTRAALKFFERSKALSPGYFDGLKSWAKSGFIYTAAGVATAGALGLAVYGIWRVATEMKYGPLLPAGLCGAAWVSSECGYKPVEYLKALLAAAVRDSANRAANSSVKNDEKRWQSNAIEAKDCRKEICKQLIAVYDDCAKDLQERYQQTRKSEESVGRLELRQIADRLEKRLPTIEKLLTRLDLGNHEIEGILQRFKDKIRFVRNHTCSLIPKKSCEKMNAELIAGWSVASIHEIAIPFSTKDRFSTAKQSRIGQIDQAIRYGSAVWSGVKVLAVSAAAATAVHAYQNGIGDTISRAKDLLGNSNYLGLPENIDSRTMAGLGVAALGATAITIKRGMDHHRSLSANAEYVECEMKACRESLQTIYDGVANHLESLRGEERSSLKIALSNRLPEIRKELRVLRIVNDPSEILGRLEQALASLDTSGEIETSRIEPKGSSDFSTGEKDITRGRNEPPAYQNRFFIPQQHFRLKRTR